MRKPKLPEKDPKCPFEQTGADIVLIIWRLAQGNCGTKVTVRVDDYGYMQLTEQGKGHALRAPLGQNRRYCSIL